MSQSEKDIFALNSSDPLSLPPPPREPPRDPPTMALDDDDLQTIVSDGSPQPPPVEPTELPRPGRGKVWAGGIVALAAVAGLGAYGWKVTGDRDALAGELAAAKDKNRSLSDALELHRASSIEMGGKLKTCTEELEEGKTSLKATDARVNELETNLASVREKSAEAKKQLAEFRAVTRRFQSMIDSGKLKVVFRHGQMIVKLPAKILFASGSAEVSKGGTKALAEVAAVLKTMRRRKFTVAGHTDNVPISTESFHNNWELSAARAVSVLEVLVDHGVPARSLAAAGFGPYTPIATNHSAAGRRLNRRIEIILEPKLKPLPHISKAKRKRTARRRKKK